MALPTHQITTTQYKKNHVNLIALISFLLGIVVSISCTYTNSSTADTFYLVGNKNYNEQQIRAIQPHLQPRQRQQRLLQDDNSSNNNTSTTITNNNTTTSCPEPEEPSNPFDVIPFAVQIILIIILILFSAGFSGLTLGLMGLDISGLEIVMEGDDESNAKCARRIYPLRKKGNLLLCTLLLGNVAVNALLSILLADKAGGIVGFLSSTFLIVIFGEILPQALCNRYALQIGSKCVPIVKVIMVILWPISKPIAFCLDKALGKELATTYSTTEMKKLLEIHVKEGRFDEETGVAMAGALNYKDIEVKNVMTPIEHTFMLNVDDKLSFNTIAKIFKTGYSRIPVYEISYNNIIGLLFVKDLIFIDPEDETPVRSFVQIFGRGAHVVWPDSNLGDVLRELKQGRSHMALVRDVVRDEDGERDPYYEIRGIITLEDIIEEILGDEIVDETDEFVDGTHSERVNRKFQMGINNNCDDIEEGSGSIDWGRLRLLDTKIVDETLSHDEANAVVAHLRTNYADTVSLLSDKQLHRLVTETPVTYYDAPEIEQAGIPSSDNLLYEKGTSTDTCTLILAGKVTVLAGSDNFRSDVSSWSVLGTKALINAPPYTPDFTAYVSSETKCRCLQFKRDVYMKAVDASTLEQQAQPQQRTSAPAIGTATPPRTNSHRHINSNTIAGSHHQQVMQNLLSTSSSIVTPTKKDTAATANGRVDGDGDNRSDVTAPNNDTAKRKKKSSSTTSRRDKLIAAMGIPIAKNNKQQQQQQHTDSRDDAVATSLNGGDIVPSECDGEDEDDTGSSIKNNTRATRKRQKSIDFIESDAALLDKGGGSNGGAGGGA